MPAGRLPVAARVLSVLGLVVASYLTWEHAHGSSPACFGGANSGCHQVARSVYSHLWGMPVAAIGLAGYAALLVDACVRGFSARAAGFAMALVAAAFSGYLTYLELGKIHAICQWCVASAVIAALLLAVHATWLWRSFDEGLEPLPEGD